jgi:hypothetical protein
MALNEPSDRRVIGLRVRGDHPVGDVLLAGPLDRPRRPRPTAIGVEQQRDHHRRLIGRPTAAVLAIGAVERGQIHRGNRVEHEPRQVALWQPLPHIGRHQERLLTITRDEPLRHARDRLKRLGRHPTYATASPGSATVAASHPCFSVPWIRAAIVPPPPSTMQGARGTDPTSVDACSSSRPGARSATANTAARRRQP